MWRFECSSYLLTCLASGARSSSKRTKTGRKKKRNACTKVNKPNMTARTTVGDEVSEKANTNTIMCKLPVPKESQPSQRMSRQRTKHHENSRRRHLVNWVRDLGGSCAVREHTHVRATHNTTFEDNWRQRHHEEGRDGSTAIRQVG